MALRAEEERLGAQLEWLKQFPMRRMMEWGWVAGRKDRVEQLRESFAALARVLETPGGGCLDEEERREAVFLASTLERAYRIGRRVAMVEALPEQAGRDRELAGEFNLLGAWAGLHFDFFRVAITRGIALPGEVKQGILEGCRVAVVAYSAVRGALDLRGQGKGPAKAGVGWDEEDESLAADSTRERESTLSEW